LQLDYPASGIEGEEGEKILLIIVHQHGAGRRSQIEGFHRCLRPTGRRWERKRGEREAFQNEKNRHFAGASEVWGVRFRATVREKKGEKKRRREKRFRGLCVFIPAAEAELGLT